MLKHQQPFNYQSSFNRQFQVNCQSKLGHLQQLSTLLSVIIAMLVVAPLSPTLAQEERGQPPAPKAKAQAKKSWLQRLRERLSRTNRTNSDTPIGPQLADELNFNPAFTPPGEKAPQSTENASSRDALRCNLTESLTRSIMPSSNYGLTVHAYPSIFIEASDLSAQQVVLAFQSESGDDYRQFVLPIPQSRRRDNTRRLLRFQLPPSSRPILTGRNYRWSLAFICGDYLEPSDPMLSGWVQRVEPKPEFTQTLVGLSAIDRGRWLSQQGYWYDAVQIADDLLQTSLSENN